MTSSLSAPRRRVGVSTAVLALAGTGAALVATPALAHAGAPANGSILSGLTHPLFGLDHLLAMSGIGLWASMQARRARFAAPVAFLLLMIGGYVLAVSGAALPGVEPMILASVIAVGLLAALAIRLPAAVCAGIAGIFALFHGHAHGSELGAANPWLFLAGFVIGTTLLLGAGYGIGRLAGSERLAGLPLVRSFGALTAAAGAALALN